ncbi:MAG: iron ABC transporter permease [Desulfobacteraceae bacterium]|nr:iron ABC transporter permease [Desulfobacteraceae bacterium]MBU4053407.1 iron ABC transporter permease [Pseudomonadota bacterium]
MAWVMALMALVLGASMLVGISSGSTRNGYFSAFQTLFSPEKTDPLLYTIIWRVRFPRVLLAALVGATLSLGGLVFQALLRNPLAEPYILGISGGSAIGAIIGILMGLTRFPGVCLMAFAGSIATLIMILGMASGQTLLKQNALLLAGVMVNAFCAAIIMFLVSMTQDAKLHNIIFWLMGDLSMTSLSQVGLLALTNIPCFVFLFILSHKMNLLLMGKDLAQSMGVNIRLLMVMLLVATSLMVSATVSHCGLLGFVGLVIPHLLRLCFGPDHRILVPACVLGGGAYMVACDTLARTLPGQGEMPAGVITALIGAPLFIILLKRSRS